MKENRQVEPHQGDFKTHPHSAQTGTTLGANLRLVAWEITRSCNLACVHCRASARSEPYAGEFTLTECRKVVDQIAEVAKPIMILTGGEPLLRPDLFDIAGYGNRLGFRMTLATNGTLLTPQLAQKAIDSGIQRISVSLDGADAQSHDAFRMVPGAFEGALRGIAIAREAKLDFQINTTITHMNIDEFPAIHELAVSLGAVAHHIFMLVPMGRGKDLGKGAISAQKYEETLHWFYDRKDKAPLQLKATCAPHYYRIMRQRAKAEGKEIDFDTFGLDAVTRGCLGGSGFVFISHVGQVQPCGYLDVDCGNLREKSFREIWLNSPVFNDLRDLKRYEGKCGNCEYIRVCGGCRARAYQAADNYLAEEPLCQYVPRSKAGRPSGRHGEK
jgi:heme b synthase